jgi:hypothetical protein
MSAIASFYLVRQADVGRLKGLAAAPVGPASGGKWHDPHWEFLFAQARELEPYDWSGYAMLEVSHFLDARSVRLDAHCDKPLSDFLSKARGSSILVFRAGPGKALAQLIAANLPDEKALEAFLASPDMVSPAGDDLPAEAVLDGLCILERWLSQLDDDHVGLLSIG